MPVTYGNFMRSERVDVIETTIAGIGPSSPLLRILTGAAPANTAAAQTGTLLVEMTLPTNCFGAAVNGVKAKFGTWSGTGVAAGTAGYFRIYDNPGTTCHIQGTAGTSGTDMILDGATIAIGQIVTVLTFTITAAGG